MILIVFDKRRAKYCQTKMHKNRFCTVIGQRKLKIKEQIIEKAFKMCS